MMLSSIDLKLKCEFGLKTILAHGYWNLEGLELVIHVTLGYILKGHELKTGLMTSNGDKK